ncbi:spermatid nucleus differentiation [Homalodisca vitripennis]|nr:spermatid nucleus differentiation [Homalodisca vitripennis]
METRRRTKQKTGFDPQQNCVAALLKRTSDALPNETLQCPLCDNSVNNDDDAVFCDGECSSWYHRQCMGMSHEHYNDISKCPSEPWLCPTCNLMEQTQGHNSNMSNDLLESINSEGKSLEELQHEVSSYHGRDIANEELLHMSAEIGSKLLAENEELKKENSKLSFAIKSKEAELEDLITKYNTLVNDQEEMFSKLDASFKQLEKEKPLRLKQQDIFNEHDNEQLRIIESYEQKVVTLESKLSRSLNGNTTEDSRNLLVSGKFIDAPPITAINLEVKLTSIKCRLVALESQLKTLNKPSPQEINPQKLYLNGSGITGPVMTISTDTTNQARNPPANSRIRHPNEIVEEFYDKHIQFYSDLSTTMRRDHSAGIHEIDHSSAQGSFDLTLPGMANNVTVTSNPSCSKPESSKYRFLECSPPAEHNWKSQSTAKTTQ